MPPMRFRLNFMGEVSLGGVIDNLLHKDELTGAIAGRMRARIKKYPQLADYNTASPWGEILPSLEGADLNLISLAAYVYPPTEEEGPPLIDSKIPARNIECLKTGNVDYATLALKEGNKFLESSTSEHGPILKELAAHGILYNNPDWRVPRAGVPIQSPVILRLSRPFLGFQLDYSVHVYSLEDYPNLCSPLHDVNDFSWIPAFLSDERIPGLKICSVHWAHNTYWNRKDNMERLSHFLIDQCSVDIVWGYGHTVSSIIEVYNGGLVLRSCGSLIPHSKLDPFPFRTLFRLTVGVKTGTFFGTEEPHRLRVQELEVFPLSVRLASLHFMRPSDARHEKTIETLVEHIKLNQSAMILDERGSEGQIIVKVT